MQEITVNRTELLTKLRDNRVQHRSMFEAALEKYRERCILELESRLEDIRAGYGINVLVNLPVPQDHTSDYDRVILQAEMSISDEITLTDQEFEAYVMDNWKWKQQFTTTNASYGVKS